MHRVVFFFKTPYFIIIHLTFITVTHYEMYVHLIHLRGCVFPHPPALAAMMRLVRAQRRARRRRTRLLTFQGLLGKADSERAVAVPATPSGTFPPCFLKGTRRLSLHCSRCRGVGRRRLGGCPPPAGGPCTWAPRPWSPPQWARLGNASQGRLPCHGGPDCQMDSPGWASHRLAHRMEGERFVLVKKWINYPGGPACLGAHVFCSK